MRGDVSWAFREERQFYFVNLTIIKKVKCIIQKIKKNIKDKFLIYIKNKTWYTKRERLGKPRRERLGKPRIGISWISLNVLETSPLMTLSKSMWEKKSKLILKKYKTNSIDYILMLICRSLQSLFFKFYFIKKILLLLAQFK